MEKPLEIKLIASVIEIRFPDLEETKRCLVWDPNKATPNYCDMQRISTLEGEGNFSIGLILEVKDE